MLHLLLQLVEGLVQVVVDDGQVKVVAVRPADPGALIHRLLQIVLLWGGAEVLCQREDVLPLLFIDTLL